MFQNSHLTLKPTPPPLKMGHLTGEVRPVTDLQPLEQEQMYTLLTRYFHNVERPQFDHDLAEKEWVILLTEPSRHQIQGFSTLMRLQPIVDQRPVTAFFSGDTIIEQRYWGETLLPRLWSQHVFSLAEQIESGPVYWFLIASGYKTYRYLPVFFRKFYPAYNRPTPPAIKRLLDTLGHLKFPTEYDTEQGIIRSNQANPLRPGVAEITTRRLKDPHVAFFAATNPGHLHGHELACLTELTHTNLTRAGQRMVGRIQTQ